MPTATFEPITSYTANGNETTIALTGLTGYRHLVIESVFSSAGGGGMLVTLNGTSINSIRHDFMWTATAGGAPNEQFNDYTGYTYINPGSNLQSGNIGMTRVHIFNASNTTHFKPYYIETAWENSFNLGYGWGTLHDTNAITQMSFTCGVNWSSGSKFTVFGLVG